MAARKEDEAARRRMQELQAQRRQIAHRQAELKMLQAQQKLQLQRGGGDDRGGERDYGHVDD